MHKVECDLLKAYSAKASQSFHIFLACLRMSFGCSLTNEFRFHFIKDIFCFFPIFTQNIGITFEKSANFGTKALPVLDKTVT
jgi:hypothetical protein